MAVRSLLLSLLLLITPPPTTTSIHEAPAPAPIKPAPAPTKTKKSEKATAAWQPPLSTRGRYIVDANGVRFKLRSADWHGASGTWTGSGDESDDANNHAGENSHRIPLGLDRAPLAEIVSSFQQLGINSVRLP